MTSTPVVRIKYSPDQPRDHGRFAETEGGGEDASSEGANQSGGGKAPSSWTSLSAPQIKVREEIAAAGLSLRHYDEMPEEEKGFLKDAGYSMWAGDKPASEATLKGIRDAAQTLAQVAPEVMKGFKEAGLRVFEARMDEDTVQMLAFRTSNDGSITPAIVINTNHSAIRSMIVGGASGSQSSRAANEELSKGGTPHQVALVSAKVGFLHETGHLVDMASKSELSKQFDRALRTAAAKEHQLPNTYTTLHLGEYANTSRAEAFAEVFASRVRTGSLPPGMSKFGETLDRVLKGQGKKSFVVKYSEDQERDDHGRFSGSGGASGGGSGSSAEHVETVAEGTSTWSATAPADSKDLSKAKERIASLLGPVEGLESLPEQVLLRLRALPATPTAEHAEMLEGVADALQSLQADFPGYGEMLKEAGTRFVLVNYEPKHAAMTAVTAPGEAPRLLVNTNHNSVEGLGTDSAWSVGAVMAGEALKGGLSLRAAVRLEAKICLYHEVGHIVDRASDGMLTEGFGANLLMTKGVTEKNASRWVEKHVSGYASTSPREGAAEEFSKILAGKHTAGLEQFAALVRRSGAPRVSKRSSRSLQRKYSDDQPRVPAGSDDGGQFTSGGDSGGGGSPSSMAIPKPKPSGRLDKDELRAVAARHGFDPNRITFKPFPPEFELMYSAGNYNQQTGEMTIYTRSSTTQKAAEGVLVHELSHVRWSSAKAFRNGYELKHFLKDNAAALSSEDGTTDYSKEFWKSSSSFELSVNESLAEMHLKGKLKPTYQKLDAVIRKAPMKEGAVAGVKGSTSELSFFLDADLVLCDEQKAFYVRVLEGEQVRTYALAKTSSKTLGDLVPVVRIKYSPDQPRDHGRFAESEGESGPASQPLSSEQEATFRRLQEADRKLRAAVDPTATGERQMLQFFGGMGREQLEAAGMFSRAALVGELGVQEPVTAGTPRMTPQRCYDNAAEKSLAGYTYIEGNVFVHGIPIAHAWNVKDGKAIDFTIPDAAKWQYIGVKVPQDVVERVITSRHFPDADDGILGAINLFKPTERAKLIAKVRAANTPQKGLVVRVKYSPDQPRDHGRFAEVEGDSGESGSGGKDPIKQGTKFDRLAWGAKPMMEARGEWKKLSNYERDMLADPTHSVEARIDDLTGGKDVPKTGEALKDISSRVDQFRGDMLVDRSADAITEFSSKAYTSLVAAGCKPEAARELALTVADYTIAQDFEAAGRSLGDHGEHHLSENARIANEVLSAAGLNNARTESLVQLAAAFHDAGYLTEPSRVFLDETHARWSAQNYQANIAPKVEAAMGKEFSRDLASLIYAHDDTLLDWNTAPLQSAFSLADNLALFHYEKMPAMMRYVPANTGVLVALARGKLDVAAAQVAMRANIASSNLPKALKTQLNNATHEVSGVLPKFTLGMVGVKMTRASWDKDHPVIHIQRYRSNEALSKVVDFGQKQFGKLAETYGGDPKAFIASGSMELNDTAGHHLLSLVISSGRKKSFGDFLRAVFKYSPDQPRDHGRFAESEGESGGREEPASSSAGRAAADKPAVLHSAWHDNPGGSWEEHERRYAQQEWEKGRKVVGSPTAGIEGRLPTLLVAELPGLLDEHRLPGILHDPKSQAIKDSVRQVGVLEPIFINVNHLGLAYINEGNHRAALARFFGHKTVPVEVRYFAGGEKIEKAWNLERLQSRYAKSLGSLLRKYSDSQERDERGRWTDDGGGEGNVTEPQLPAPGSRDSKLPRLNVSPQKADLAIDSALVQLEKHVAKNPGTEVMVAVPANKPAADWVAVHLRNANDPYFLAVGEGGRVEPSYNADLAFRVGSSEFVDPKTGEKALWDVVHNHLQEKSQVTEPFSMLDYTTFHKSEGIRTLTAKSFEGSVYTLQMTTKLASAAPFNPINEVRVSDFADSSQKVQEALYVQLRSRVGGERDREKLKPWVAEHNAAVQHSLGIVYDKLGWMQYRTRLSPAAEKHYAEKKQFINDLVRDTLKSLPQNLRDPYSKRPSSYVEPLKSLGAMLRKYREDQPRDHGRFAETEGGDDGDSGSGTQSGGAAELTGLHYDKGGKRWMRSDGKPASEETDARLRALGMPPAYTDVKLNPDPTEPLQATGVAANGKTQYKFLKEHTEQAAAENFARLRDFNKVASSVRAKLGKEMKDVNLPTSRRDAAAALLLIDKSAIRVGGEGETRAAVKAYGATTLLGKHVTLGAEGKIDLEFPGKSGQVNRATFKDVVLHRYLSEKGLKANARVFATTDRGARLAMTRAAGEGYTPKDFRTWIGTATALREVAKAPIPKTKSEYRHQRIAVSKVVAAKLNNTPAMALKAYIDPAVFKRWEGARP